MGIGRISLRSVAEASPADKEVFLWDDKLKGFGLKVSPGGTKTYVFQYRADGASYTKRATLGRHGSITPDQAREMASKMYAEVRLGGDPVEQKRERCEKARAHVDLAFGPTFDRYRASRVATGMRPRTLMGLDCSFRRYITPRFAGRNVAAITPQEIMSLINDIPADLPGARKNVFDAARGFFRWLVGRGLDKSPFDAVLDAPRKSDAREHVLGATELSHVWNASYVAFLAPRGAYSRPRVGAVYRLLIITGQRRTEVCALEWSELDRAAAEWTIPKERSKNRRSNVVFLSDLAIAELDGLAGGTEWPTKGLVFLGSRGASYKGYTHDKPTLAAKAAELAARAGDEPIRDWVLHDFRRTFASGLQRLGIRREVIEACLNHLSGQSGIVGIYQRYDYASEQRTAMQAWADQIRRLTDDSSDSNVVQLARRA